jgi:hypothetical protein
VRAVLEFVDGGILVSGDGEENEDDGQTSTTNSNP